MSLVFLDGFDFYTAAQLTLKGWSLTPTSMVAGRFGGQAVRFTAFSTMRTKSLGGSFSTVIIGFAYRATAFGDQPSLVLQSSPSGSPSGSTLQFQINAAGHIQISNSTPTIIATGTTIVPQNTWSYIEIKLVIAGASGSVTVHLNGAPEIATTTGNFGTSNVNTLGITAVSGSNLTADWDDIYVCSVAGTTNNDFLGDVRIVTARPIGAGSHTQFQPNGAASNWQCVDETTPNDDTDYVSDANPGDIDTYDFSTIDGGASVFGVQNNLYARKDDANLRQIASVIRQAGTDYVGATSTLSSSYAFYGQLYDKDPTGANWTAINLNADEFGVKEIA